MILKALFYKEYRVLNLFIFLFFEVSVFPGVEKYAAHLLAVGTVHQSGTGASSANAVAN